MLNGGSHTERRSQAWYAVWTHSHCERLVAEQLSAKGFDAFLPEMRGRSRAASHSSRKRRAFLPAPMFPGYLFVRDALDKARYIEILKVRGIVRVLEDGWTRLTPIPDSEIEAIQRVIDANVDIDPHPHLRHGDRVRVVEGPLSGVEGIFLQDRQHKSRLILSVDLLGRSVSVEVEDTAVVPVAA